MSDRLKSSIERRDGSEFVQLGGYIDEDNDLAELAQKIGGGFVSIDLAQIERINSCGVRDWVNFVGALKEKGARILLTKCSAAIVSQMNLVQNFTQDGIVKSFYIPYFCPECESEKALLCESTELSPPYEPPMCRCDNCDFVMEFDDVADFYFSFLAAQQKAIREMPDIVATTPAEGLDEAAPTPLPGDSAKGSQVHPSAEYPSIEEYSSAGPSPDVSLPPHTSNQSQPLSQGTILKIAGFAVVAVALVVLAVYILAS